MKKTFFKLFGIIALAAVIGFSMIACDNSGGGGGSSIPTPASNVRAFTGVDGTDIYEIVNTTANPGRAVSSEGWAVGNTYKVFKNGNPTPIDSGTITNIEGGKISFSGSTGDLTLSTGAVTIGGASITVSAPQADVYYCIGAETSATSASDITSVTNGMTAEGVLKLAIDDIIGGYTFILDGSVVVAGGSWEDMKDFAQYYNCPNSLISSTTNTLNKSISAWGYYNYGGGWNVFFITRSKAIANKTLAELHLPTLP